MFNFSILGIPFYMIVFFFFIYSFLGWISEVGYAYHNRKIFVNRGFLFGPLCPIYGSSLVLVIVLTNEIKSNLLLLFIFATIITSALEYFTGVILENLFKLKWWDYTDDPFNLHGYICLHFSIMWGVVTTVIIKIIHPVINSLVLAIPTFITIPLFYVLVFLVLLDFCFTLKSLIQLKPIIVELSKITSELKNRYISILSITKEKTLDKVDLSEISIKDLLSKYNNYYNGLSFNHKRLLKAFPTVSILSLDKLIKQLKEKFLQVKYTMKDELLELRGTVLDEDSDFIDIDEKK